MNFSNAGSIRGRKGHFYSGERQGGKRTQPHAFVPVHPAKASSTKGLFIGQVIKWTHPRSCRRLIVEIEPVTTES